MPSPFPGMDPYLEGPSWMSFHGQLIAEIGRQLAPHLRPKYVALMDEHEILDAPEDDPWINPKSVLHRRVEIRDVANRNVVAVVEVLSNATKRGPARGKYLVWRQTVLQMGAHLIEIDLLRHGHRVPMEGTLPACPYFVFVSRAQKRPAVGVWPIRLPDRLPLIPVPLLPGDDDVTLDVQSALTAVYDGVGYDLILDYGRPPATALDAEDAAWAQRLLNATGKSAPDAR
jgi:hypothetical protein